MQGGNAVVSHISVLYIHLTDGPLLGLFVWSLTQVKAAPDKRRLILVFKERTLTIEATSAEQYDFLFNGFSLACTSNGGLTEQRPASMRNLGTTKRA
jgi:hypothetical protein